MTDSSESTKLSRRIAEIFRVHLDTEYRNIDRMFAVLLLAEWAIAIVLALVYSPYAWEGEAKSPHIHVWIALFLGAAIVSLPIALAVGRPGRLSTRSFVAVGQMLMVGLLIHLASGRPEFHFHVFVSLAFLALYRDWRMLLIGGAVVAIDHFLRGIYWPRSIFGLSSANTWRWVEHSLWVVFESGVLSFAITRSRRMILDGSIREAEVEATRDRIELMVLARTAELQKANAKLLVEIRVRGEAEKQALLSRQLAEDATNTKSQFLANMSHEIRTPMNAIIGMTELTLDTEMTEEQRAYLGIVRSSADSLLVLIDEILDFSKIEANRLEIESVSFCLRDTIDEAIKTLSIRGAEKKLEITSVVDSNIPEWLDGDPHRLRQVLLNLLGNAIKFTNKGKVELAIELDRTCDDMFVLHFSVSDEGIGIPATRVDSIFEPFIQADGSTTRRFGGTGLGLSICSGLIELMGGRIWVESEVGRGSTFHFTACFHESGRAELDELTIGSIEELPATFDR